MREEVEIVVDLDREVRLLAMRAGTLLKARYAAPGNPVQTPEIKPSTSSRVIA